MSILPRGMKIEISCFGKKYCQLNCLFRPETNEKEAKNGPEEKAPCRLILKSTNLSWY